jgi:hypothetical protein
LLRIVKRATLGEMTPSTVFTEEGPSMRKRLFTAMLALAVAPGFSVGGDEFFSSSRELLPTSVPPSQGAARPSAVSVESAPRTGVNLDGKPGPDVCTRER